MKIKKISPSAYNTYDQCEWKYFLQSVCYFRDESGSAATMGHIVHKILEILSQLKILKHDPKSKFWNFEYLWTTVYNRYQKERPAICQQIKEDKLKKICSGLYNLLHSNLSPTTCDTIATEKYFTVPLERPSFIIDPEAEKPEYFSVSGIIDRIDKIDEESIMIFDYKTGSNIDYDLPNRPKIDSEILKTYIQPRIYHLAAKHMYPNVQNFIILFYYLASNSPIYCILTDEDLEDTIGMLEKRYLEIKNNVNPSRIIGTKNGWQCKVLCDHFKTGLCEKIWQEKEQTSFEFVTDKYVTLNYSKGKK